MTAELLARLGGPVSGGGLALLVLAPAPRARLAGLALWAAGMALLMPVLAPSGRGLILLAGGLVGLLLAAGLALLFRRVPWALGFLAVGLAPVRVPVAVGEESASLLVPLYAVVAGAALALAWSFWRGEGRCRELGLLAWPLALLVLWIGLSALWSRDPQEAAVQLFFFVGPFALLALTLVRLPWNERALAGVGGLLLAMATVFATVGLWQWLTREVFWNPKVIEDNAYAPFFRVNSLFWDPSIYGRFLVVAIIVALAVLLFGPWRRPDVALGLLVVGLWVALLVSFSQSSFVALLVGVALAAVLAWRWRAALALGLVAAVMIPVGVAAPQLENVRDRVTSPSGGDLNRATRGRVDLVSNGLRIASDHPLTGVGVGAFERAYTDRAEGRQRFKEPASHNAAVTITAENGLVGLLLLAWLLAAALVASLGRTRAAPASVRIAGLVAGLGLAVIFVHSLFYNAFLDDPLVWGFMALAALATRESFSVERSPART